jgi:RNA polymerase sigma-70 factor (ECF subfamily)
LEPLKAALAAFCRRSLNRTSDIEDALQSAVANAYREFDLYAEGTNFRAWIFRFLSYEVLNRNRATARRREVDLPEDLPQSGPMEQRPLEVHLLELLLDDPEVVLDDCDASLTRSLRSLSDLERNIFLLRAIGDFKYREIAEILDAPIGTVMGLLSRARQRLRQGLLEYAKEHRLLPHSGDGPTTEPT